MNADIDNHARETARALAGAVMPQVSIVISNFNYARFLRQAVESALAQSHPAVEVIVVDDGSSDRSIELLAQLKVEYPKLVVIVQENRGQAAAINRGLQQVRGEWILFLDSDDALDPKAVETALGAAGADDAVVQFYLRTVDKDGVVIGLHPFCHVLESGNVFAQICASGHFRFMPTSGNIFRRVHLAAILPIPEKEWRICADTYLVIAAASQGRVRTVGQVLGSYRIHDANGWYEEAPSEAKLNQIMRNHLVLWEQLLGLRPHWPAGFNDYALLSLVRRIMISLFLYRDRDVLPRNELAKLRGKLCRLILCAKVSLGEKLLHLVLLHTMSRSKNVFKNLLIRRPGWVAHLRSPHRDDWIARTALPLEITELPLERTIEFGQGGKGRAFDHYGFGETENWRSWSSAERAGLIFKVPDMPTISLSLDVTPYLCAPIVESQRVEIYSAGKVLFVGTLSARTKISFDLTKDIISEDRIVALEIVIPDAVVPALIDPKSNVTRVTAIALSAITAHLPASEKQPERYPPLMLGERTSAVELLAQQSQEGWSCSRGYAHFRRRRANLRFSLPNPAMERFVVRVEFERVPSPVLGDWRVSVELSDIARDTIDLRETDSALLIVPRGKAPKTGLFDLICHAYDILPWPGEDENPPGPRLKSIALRRFDLVPGKLSLWRAHQIVNFSEEGGGRSYLMAGWHVPDRRGAWSADTRATLGGYYFEDPGEVFVTLRISAWSASSLPRQRVRILANGVVIAECDVEQPEDVLAIVPERLIDKDRHLKLEIESLFIVSMRTLDDEEATIRNVGVCLEKLVLQPLATSRSRPHLIRSTALSGP